MRIGMDNSPSVVAGTMYNLYNSLSNVGQIAIGAIAIGLLVEMLGDFRLGWQIGILFLFLALIPGLALTRWREARGPVGEGETSVIIDGEL
jgi:MFS family permease